jgi:CHAD domain-containing protein
VHTDPRIRALPAKLSEGAFKLVASYRHEYLRRLKTAPLLLALSSRLERRKDPRGYRTSVMTDDSFTLDPVPQLGAEIVRLCLGRADHALALLAQVAAGSDDKQHESIHEARKRLKELRAALRLGRGALGAAEVRRIDRLIRSAAHELAPAREAAALVESLHSLLDRFREEVSPEPFESVQSFLVERRDTGASHALGAERIVQAQRTLRQARDELGALSVTEDRVSVLSRGLSRGYRRGRKAFATAFRAPSPEALHALRRRVKEHLYQIELVAGAWPRVFGVRAKELKRLSDLLGDDHDLAALRTLLAERATADVSPPADPMAIGVLLTLVERRSVELRRDGRALSERLYAEAPKALERRLRRYLALWRAEARPEVVAPAEDRPAPRPDEHPARDSGAEADTPGADAQPTQQSNQSRSTTA